MYSVFSKELDGEMSRRQIKKYQIQTREGTCYVAAVFKIKGTVTKGQCLTSF